MKPQILLLISIRNEVFGNNLFFCSNVGEENFESEKRFNALML